MARPTARRGQHPAPQAVRHGRRWRSGVAATGVLLLLLAACAWWGAAVRAERFDDDAVLPAGVPAATLEVPVGAQAVLWSSAGEAVDGAGDGVPRCTARDLTFDQQLPLTEPVADYRRGALAGMPGRALDAVVPPRWTPVAVLHTGGGRLRLVCDPAATGDLAISRAPEVVTGAAAWGHGWTPLALGAAALTVGGVGLLAWAQHSRRRARDAGRARVVPVQEPGPREPVWVPHHRRSA